jgi:hypothetical protein
MDPIVRKPSTPRVCCPDLFQLKIKYGVVKSEPKPKAVQGKGDQIQFPHHVHLVAAGQARVGSKTAAA